MLIPINPYIAGDPVGNSAAFVGREDVLREVLKVLRSPSQNAITLFGQRRIGKTSMLQYLQSHLPQEGHYQAVYFDLQDKASLPLGRVLFDLARTIADRLNLPAPAFNAEQAESFSVWMKETLASLPAEANLVLLFDEFDVLVDPQSGQAAAEFFPYLRNLLSLDPARLQFIFVLGRNITDLSSIALSVFKGIPSKRVSLLNQAETLKVARLSEQNRTLLWPEVALETVWKLTHGHPYLTQALCLQVWEAAYDDAPDETPKATPEMVEAAASAALDTSRNMLEWLWNGLGPAEKVVSAALAGAGNVIVDEIRLEQILRESGVRILIRELQNAPELLKDWDILEAADGGYIFRVELLRRWIAQYHPLKRTQDELDRIQPAADNLFRAAEAFYQQGDLIQAENLLQQAIRTNPNHLRANELLAELLIGSNRLDEAREKLEKLFEFAPHSARPRLVQVYLLQAEAALDDKTRLALYEKVLGLDSLRPEARAGVEKIKKLEQEEKELAFNFVEGRQALQRGEWPKAIELLQKVVQKRPAYTYDDKPEAETAADLLAQAVRENKQRIPRWKILLRQTQTLYFLGGALVLLVIILFFGMGQQFVSLGTQGYGPLKNLATPTFTLTPSITPTLTSTVTLTPTKTNIPLPTNTPTITLTPTLFPGATSTPRADGMVMVYIPAGTFRMGSEKGNSDEAPIHEVTLDAFWMDLTEVTNRMYALCVQAGKCQPPSKNSSSTHPDYHTNSQYADFPVINVNWSMAKTYCEWAGDVSTGSATTRLPTEAEWEYAARGKDTIVYPWGNDPPDSSRANYGSNIGDTTKVGSYPDGKSPFGLLDMAGNVLEWVNDWYDSGYYKNSPAENPPGPPSGKFRVFRGGSWDLNEYYLRVSFRYRNYPVFVDYSLGFRCARSR